MSDDIIDVAFGLVPSEKNDVGPSVTAVKIKESAPPTQEDLYDDFTAARANIREVIETAKGAAKEVSDIAYQSQAHKDYEALAGSLKVILEANRDLVDLHTKVQKLSDNIGGAVKNIQNNLFLGSTADLQKFIADMRKNETDA